MVLWKFALLGAGGGGLIELVAFYNRLSAWQAARRTTSGRMRRHPPSFNSYIDAWPAIAVLVTRLVLGALAALAFRASNQASGGYAALTMGAAAPAFLAQLGQLHGIRNALGDSPPGSSEEPQPTGAAGGIVPPAVPAGALFQTATEPGTPREQ